MFVQLVWIEVGFVLGDTTFETFSSMYQGTCVDMKAPRGQAACSYVYGLRAYIGAWAKA